MATDRGPTGNALYVLRHLQHRVMTELPYTDERGKLEYELAEAVLRLQELDPAATPSVEFQQSAIALGQRVAVALGL